MKADRHALHHPLLDCFRAGLDAVDGRRRVRAALAQRPYTAPVALISLGKAAGAMARGALEAWGVGIDRGLVVSKPGHIPAPLIHDPRLRCIESAHPVPDARSLEAGQALLDFIDGTPRDGSFLVLISGGTSSLVEALPAGMGLADLQRLNRWLLGSGLAIERMNAIRSAVSCIKGGRLGARLQGRPIQALLLSDVPGNDPATIGSGLLFAPEGPTGLSGLPSWVEAMVATVPPAPRHTPTHLRWELVGSIEDAMGAAAARAEALGHPVVCHPRLLVGDAQAAGETVAGVLLSGAARLHVWGGETTVRLPPRPGRGGRCQHLALAAARRLAGHHRVALLAAGTDGSDGPTGEAGALADGTTLARGREQGLDPDDCLARADAGSFLGAADALVRTGPTGTNVMDLVLGLRLPDS